MAKKSNEAPAAAEQADPFANVMTSGNATGNGASSADLATQMGGNPAAAAPAAAAAPDVAIRPASEVSDAPPIVREGQVANVVTSGGMVVASQGPGRYRVEFHPPTPVAHNEIVCDATSEEDAWKQLMDANGICASQHCRTVVRLGDATGESTILTPPPKPLVKPVVDGVPVQKPVLQPA